MEVLKGGLDSFFNEIFDTINQLTYQVNHEILNIYTLDMCVHFQNNLSKLEENLTQRKTDIELALLSVSNIKNILEKMKKEFSGCLLNQTHSG